eukprot:TRINITY_DN55932_c0_g1_i1.p1 TRINITY_DN55932_c0_g1~~TRINITY_DN55932_c0_g1_i1.p1  ORF type:complete len:186 (+),score=19.15 TRINITY_DN55932_c0_g1_i1:66-560(+)
MGSCGSAEGPRRRRSAGGWAKQGDKDETQYQRVRRASSTRSPSVHGRQSGGEWLLRGAGVPGTEPAKRHPAREQPTFAIDIVDERKATVERALARGAQSGRRASRVQSEAESNLTGGLTGRRSQKDRQSQRRSVRISEPGDVSEPISSRTPAESRMEDTPTAEG